MSVKQFSDLSVEEHLAELSHGPDPAMRTKHIGYALVAIDELRAENERLRQQLEHVRGQAENQWQFHLEAKAEVDRLRAALEALYDFPEYPSPSEGEVSTSEDWEAQENWRQDRGKLDAAIVSLLGRDKAR